MLVRPFIKKFKTKKYNYIYDINTNHFLRVDDIVFSVIDEIYELSEEIIIDRWKNNFDEISIKSSIKNIKEAIKKGIFSSSRPRCFHHLFSKSEIIETLKNALTHLTLEVTQQCNLRCLYCSYSGAFYYKRCHNQRDMDFAVAKKAIDFFLNHSNESENIFISFYGGEPLLNYSQIKKCVEYINEANKSKNVHYSITTNGILLREEIINFLKKNSFFLTISLDGPQEVNDAFRIFSDGKGTFNIIIKNISLLHDKGYPPELVKLNITIVLNSKLTDQMKYFDKLFKEKGYSLNPFYVNTKESILNEIIIENPGSLYSPYIKELRNNFKQYLINNNVENSPFLKSLFSARFRKIYNRGSFDRFKLFYSPNGACIPGWEKLFVAVDGNFYICEKMTDFVSIGNVERGFDIKRIFEILEKYCEMCLIDCRDCWAIRLCKACYVAAKKNRWLDLEERRKYCNNLRENLLSDLIFYLEVLEENPAAFDFFAKENTISYMAQRIEYMRSKSDIKRGKICSTR